MTGINLQDRSGLPKTLRDGVMQSPDRWLVLTKAGRKVAELPVEDLDGMNSADLEVFFEIQEMDGRNWHIEHRYCKETWHLPKSQPAPYRTPGPRPFRVTAPKK